MRKRLSYTTHKLELLQSEFDSTRQYLETELRRAQEELDKFTDKLRRWAHIAYIIQGLKDDALVRKDLKVAWLTFFVFKTLRLRLFSLFFS